MARSATVRVKPKAGTPHARPKREELEEAAKLLTESGFSVNRIGRFGISLSADDAVFKRELGVILEPGKPLVALIKPRRAPLARLVDLIEITGAPDYFGN